MKPVGRIDLRGTMLWWGLPALAVSFGVLRSFEPRGAAVFAVSQALFLFAVWSSVAGSVAGRRAAPRDGAERNVWTLLAAACLSIAVGQTYLSLYQVIVDARGPLGFSVTDVFNIAGALAFTGALGAMVASTGLPRAVKARRLMDATGVTVVGFAIAYTVLSRLTHEVPGPLMRDALNAAYVVLGLVVLGMVSLVVLTPRDRRWTRWERVLVGALGLFGVCVTLAPVWRTFVVRAGVQGGEVLLAVGFVCSYYLIFIAGVLRSHSVRGATFPVPSVSRATPFRPDVAAFVAFTALLVAIPALGVGALRAETGSSYEAVYFTSMALVGSVMVARTGLDAVYAGRLRRRAGSDPLTGVSNPRVLQARLAEAVRVWGRYGEPVSVVVFDVNDFRRVNTLYGVEEGDRLLRAAAHAVRSVAPQGATVGRLAGDEFAVVLEGSGRREALICASQMRDGLRQVLTSAGLPLTASWGVASCPEDSTRSRDLLNKAYAAQYWAKARGKDLVVAYDAEASRSPDHVARMAAAGEQSEIDMLLAVAVASESRHDAARFHSRNVAALAVRVAEHLGMGPSEVRDVEVAGLLHDIGKIGVPDEVLGHRSPRSRAEEAVFREHVVIGERIVAASRFRRIAPAIRAHHERWDGSGYPDGLAGERIPRIARVIAACDAFEGMTAGRPDRAPLSGAAAVQDLDQNMGFAYDPEVAEALISIVSGRPPDTWDEQDVSGWPR